MATDMKPSVLPKHEKFVEQQLDRVSKRLHVLDLGWSVLLLLAVVLGHALVMAVLDLVVGPKPGAFVLGVRIGIWVMSLILIAYLGALFTFRALGRINPYYAARQVEETLPNAKNSVVNWLDLRARKLPDAVKTALGLRAAQDLKTTDPEQSIQVKKNTWVLAVLAGLLFVGLVSILLSEPGRFGSLMQRAFLPLGDGVLASRTGITLLHPAGGDITVQPQQKIRFHVKTTGPALRMNQPGAPRLFYRYQQNDEWLELPMKEETDGTWTESFLSDQVRNGFWYKITAGDTETPEHQVTVRSKPEARRFEFSFKYPPYLQPYFDEKDQRLDFEPHRDALYPSIKAPRGTEVTLVVRTNRELLDGKVELSFGNSMDVKNGQVLADDAKAFRVKFTLDTAEKSGQFKVRFTTRTGDENNDSSPYDVQVIQDFAPFKVELTKPGKDVTLPINGTLELEGIASDDFGIKRLVLHMEVLQGPIKKSVAPKVYRPEKDLRFKEGAYPDSVDYKDFVVLRELKSQAGVYLHLATGDVVAYWLEATDNCDLVDGRPHVSRSRPYRVTIGDPQDEKKMTEQVQQAQKEQKKHDRRQDEKFRQQEEDRRQKKESQRGDRDEAPDPQKAAERQKEQDDVNQKLEEGLRQQAQKGPESKPLTPKDVDKAKDLAKEPGAVGDLANQELNNAAKRAEDPEVREAADEALKNQDFKPGQEPSVQDIKDLTKALKEKGPLADAIARKLAQAAKKAKEDPVRKAAEEALKDRPDPNKKQELTEKEIKDLKDALKDLGPVGDMANRELEEAAQKAAKNEIREAAKDALKDRPPQSGQKQADRQPTKQDIERLQKMMKENEGRLGDAAAEELAKMSKEAKEEAMRKAVEKALKSDPSGRQQTELSDKDVAKLKDMLDKNPALRDLAERELKDAARNAKDQKVREAAQDALKKQPSSEPTAKDVERLQKLAKDKGRLGDAAADELAKIAEQAKDQKIGEAAEEALKKTGRQQTDPSSKDVAKLKETLKQEGAAGDFAQRELAKAAQGAKNEKVRKAAEEALKNQPPRPPRPPTEKDVESLKEMAKDKGPLGQAAARELSKISQDAKDEKTRKAADAALREARADRQQTDLTANDVPSLKEMSQKPGPIGDMANRELKQAAQQTRDEKLRQAAQEALKNQPPHSAQEPTAKDVKDLKKIVDDNGPLADAAARALARIGQQAKSSETRQAARDALKETGREPAEQKQSDPLRDVTKEDVAVYKELLKKEGLLGEMARRQLAEIARRSNDKEIQKAAEDALKNPPKTEPLTPDDVDFLENLARQPGQLGEAGARELARLARQTKNKDLAQQAEKALKNLGRDAKLKHDPVQDASKENVAQLKELRKKDGLLGDLANERLAEIARLARDREVRQAAEEALRTRGKAEKITPEDVARLKKLADDPGPLGDAAARELDRLAQQSQDPEVSRAAKRALNDSERDPLSLERKRPDPRALPADLASAIRSGSMSFAQWEEIGKKFGLSREQVDQAINLQLEAARRNAAKEDPLNQLGNPALSSSTGPTRVGSGTNGNSPTTQGDPGQPPPEFHDAFIRWSTRRQNPDRK